MNGLARSRFANWSRLAQGSILPLCLATLAGCGGGGTSLLGGSPTGTIVLDANQTVTLTASVVNDTAHHGVTWAVSGSGTLGASQCTPLGDSSQCTILFTPPSPVTAPVSTLVTATSISNTAHVVTFPITIDGALLITSPAALPAAIVGVPYSYTFLATGGTGTITWSVASGSLPAGLTLSAKGVLAGTPTSPAALPATSAFTIAATDTATAPNRQTQAETLLVNAPIPVLNAAALPNAAIGQAYTQQLTFTGGAGAGTFAIASGSLPASSGLTLSPSGLLAGIPAAGTVGATYSFAVTVASGGQTSAPRPYSLTIVNPLVITSPATLPAGTTGTPYSYQLTASGGSNAGYTWSLASGALPTGLASVPATGLLSFTPSAAGTFTFSVKVVDSGGNTASSAESITITATPLVISTTTLPATAIGAAYSQQLAYTGGPGGTPAWALTTGALPAGLTLGNTGLVSGRATTAGSYTFSVTVTVAGQSSAPRSFTIAVSSLLITSPNTAMGEVGLPFRDQLQVSGGTAPYTWSFAAGSAALPTGLTLSASGLLSGTAAGPAGAANVTVQVQDATGTNASQALSITIQPARANTGNALLSGQYAFVLSGFDPAGNPLALAGNFLADGAGNIVSGTLDLNGTSVAQKLNAPILPGTYAIGADQRGRVTLATAASTFSFTLAVHSLVAPATTSTGGYLSEFDLSGQTLSGVLFQQTPAAFSTTAIQGGYTFGLSGFTTSVATHAGLIGEMQLSGTTGTLASGEIIESTRGTTPLAPTSGTYAIATTGRGTLTLVVAGSPIDLIVYPIATGQLLLLSSDLPSATTPLLTGQALGQTITNGSFNATALNGTAISAISRNVMTGALPAASVQLGLLSFTNSTTAALTADLNIAGTASAVSQSGSYTVAPNGRFALALGSGIGGCINCANPQTLGYLSGPNRGFTLDSFAGAGTGTLEPQAAGPYSAASFNGVYASGAVQPVAVTPLDTAALTANGSATVAEADDTAQPALLTPDVAATLTVGIGANGRATYTSTDQSSGVLYFVSPGRALLLPLSSAAPAIQEVQ